MADFTLDTSGTVHFSTAFAKTHGLLTFCRWSDLDAFTQGYVEALFASFSEAHHKRPALKVGDKVRVHTEETGTITKIIPGKLKSIQVRFADGGGQYFSFECSDAPLGFSDLSPEALAMILADCAEFKADPRCESPDDMGAENGRAFWTLRQHGAGEGSGFPPLTVTLGDDGKAHLTSGAA